MIQTNVPSKVWDFGHRSKGKVIGIIHQSCGACGGVQEKLIAKWSNGRKTYLCPRAIKYLSVNTIQIL